MGSIIMLLNPYDTGRTVGKILASQLLTEQLKNKKRVIVVYSGRFQPFHAGHNSAYEHLVEKFGVDNVYIGKTTQRCVGSRITAESNAYP